MCPLRSLVLLAVLSIATVCIYSPLNEPHPTEVGEQNPLENNDIRNPATIIIKAKLTTSSTTLSLSNPDPDFRLIVSLETFHSPRPELPITISTGRSAIGRNAYTMGCILVGISEKAMPLRLCVTDCPHYAYEPTENRDLNEIGGIDFITIPASGHRRLELPLPLEQMLEVGNRSVEDLIPGMRYRVWMKHEWLDHAPYSYWGDVEGDLKDKKFSNQFEPKHNKEQVDYQVLESDGWVLRAPKVHFRGNVGHHGPVFEFVE